MVCQTEQLFGAGPDVLGVPEEHVPMTTRNDFVRRHRDDSADDSICLHCFLTVSAVHGGANLREMERRHTCDPMTTVDSQNIPEGVVVIGEAFENYLFEDSWFEDCSLNLTDEEQKKILQRLKKYGRQGLAIMKRTGNGDSG